MGVSRYLGVCLVALALAVSASGSAQQTGKTVRRHRVAEQADAPELTRAEAALDKKDYAAAEPLLKKVVVQEDGNFRAWFDLGYIYTATNRRDDAIAAYRKSVAAKADVFESNLNLGLLLAQKSDPQAEQYLRAATKLKPTAHPEIGLERAWLSLGQVLQASKPQDALDAFAEAAKLQPRDPEPHLSAGAVLEQKRDFPAAQREYQQVLALSPNSSEALAGLINVYMKSKRLPEAETLIRRYLVANPKDGRAHIQLGRLLIAQGKPADAIAELQQGVPLAPDDASAARDLGFAYETTGKYSQAEAIYRSLLAKTPNDAELHYSLGSALMNQHKYAASQAELVAALKLKPDQPEALAALAVAASENKDYVLTLKALDARSRFASENPASYFLRATAYDHLRQRKLAADNYRRFLDVSNGKNPEQEWQARHRLIAIDPKK